MSRTQAFPKLTCQATHLLEVAKLAFPLYLASQAKLGTRFGKLRESQAMLSEWKLYCSQMILYKRLGSSLAQLGSDLGGFGWCPGQMRPSPPMELFGTHKGSLISQNYLEDSIEKLCTSIYKTCSEVSRTSHRLPLSFTLDVEKYGCLQPFLEPSTLFPPMAKCRQF